MAELVLARGAAAHSAVFRTVEPRGLSEHQTGRKQRFSSRKRQSLSEWEQMIAPGLATATEIEGESGMEMGRR